MQVVDHFSDSSKVPTTLTIPPLHPIRTVPIYKGGNKHEAIMFLFESKAPLGGPVDPDVYMMQNRSSSVGRGPKSEALRGFDEPRA